VVITPVFREKLKGMVVEYAIIGMNLRNNGQFNGACRLGINRVRVEWHLLNAKPLKKIKKRQA
jgi:hypothetical protein